MGSCNNGDLANKKANHLERKKEPTELFEINYITTEDWIHQ